MICLKSFLNKIQAFSDLFKSNKLCYLNVNKYYLKFWQMFAASGPLIVTLGSGMTVGFSAVLLPQLKDDHSVIKISSHQESWIGELFSIEPLMFNIIQYILCQTMVAK